jgi:hypothetical protein
METVDCLHHSKEVWIIFRLKMFRTMAMRIRNPLRGDKVILSNKSLGEKNGLFQNQIATVLSVDRHDPNYYYRVSLPGSLYTVWFAKSDLILSDPMAVIPKPRPPEGNECCGSECPDCVWIQYWEDLNDWEALQLQPTQID